MACCTKRVSAVIAVAEAEMMVMTTHAQAVVLMQVRTESVLATRIAPETQLEAFLTALRADGLCKAQ